jgi:hypothetical protein
VDRHIRAEDINRAQVFHAIEVHTDLWHWTAPGYPGVFIASWESLITTIANMIGEGRFSWLIARAPGLPVDKAGNTWIDHEYLAPHQYLPRLIPKEAPSE